MSASMPRYLAYSRLIAHCDARSIYTQEDCILISCLSLTIGDGTVFITISYGAKSKFFIGKIRFAKACAGRADDVVAISNFMSSLARILATAAPVRPKPITNT